jgi:hypothetical protein
MTALFYHNEEQKKIALETRDKHAAKLKMPIKTQILPATEFTIAEDYHQKYMLRNDAGFMKEFRAMYPDDKDFVRSTAAARVNAYVSGNGTLEQLKKEIDSFGLSEESKKALLKMISK